MCHTIVCTGHAREPLQIMLRRCAPSLPGGHIRQIYYVVFDRYFDFSIKSVTRSAQAGLHVSRWHGLNLQCPLPLQKVVANNKQLTDLTCEELGNRKTAKEKLVITSQGPLLVEISKGFFGRREDLQTLREEAGWYHNGAGDIETGER